MNQVTVLGDSGMWMRVDRYSHKMSLRLLSIFKKIISSKEVIILFAVIVLSVVFYFTSTNHSFISKPSLGTMVIVGSEYGVFVVGVAMLMIAGEFDLSVGSILGFSAYGMAVLYSVGLNPFLAMPAILGGGVAIGAINGLITTKTGIPSFIVTLGMMWFWRGILYGISAGAPMVFRPEKTSQFFASILTGKIGGIIPLQFAWFSLFTVILSLLLTCRRFGNHVFATGGDKITARAMGINTDRIKIICFMLVGVLCAFAGVMQSTRLHSAYATQGQYYELEAIAAVVIGGTSLFGGVGTIVGAFLGVMIIRIINTGLITSRIPGYWFRAVIGITLIAVVILNIWLEKRRSRRR